MKKFLLIFFSVFLINNSVNADFKQLELCKESKIFEKRLNSSIKKTENRLKFYIPNSDEFKSLTNEISRTNTRFNQYKEKNLFCGKDGLPHLVKFSELLLPSLLFLYISGWIGWSGRQYLRYSTKSENPFENEIIINIPIAFLIINSGFLWPINVWKEFISGDLLASDDQITISPR